MFSGDTPSQPADLDARVERCRRVVDMLVEVGMNLVRTLDPEFGPATVRDPFQAYCRVSRALRLTLMIEAHLAALADEGAVAIAAERRLAERSEADPEDEPGGEAPDQTEAAEALGHMAVEHDRQDPDEVGRFLSRPIAEIAAMVCRDFGLSTAEAGQVQAAFADLIANDDADDPDPGGPGFAALGEVGGGDVQRRTSLRSRAPPERWPP